MFRHRSEIDRTFLELNLLAKMSDEFDDIMASAVDIAESEFDEIIANARDIEESPGVNESQNEFENTASNELNGKFD